MCLVCACSFPPRLVSADAATQPAPVSEAQRIVHEDPSSLLSPLYAFETSALPLNAVESKIEQRIAKCMSQGGFIYHPVTAVAAGLWTVGDYWTQRKRSGFFAVNQSSALPAGERANQQYFASLPTAKRRAYRIALYGSSTLSAIQTVDMTMPPSGATGCNPEARREVLEPLPLVNPVVVNADLAAEDVVFTSEAMAAAEAGWLSCMHAAGVAAARYDSIAAAYQSAASEPRHPSGAALAKEQGEALVDAACYVIQIQPVRHRLEINELLSLVKRFPEYRTAAASVTSAS
jgi:hypothetical protein